MRNLDHLANAVDCPEDVLLVATWDRPANEDRALGGLTVTCGPAEGDGCDWSVTAADLNGPALTDTLSSPTVRLAEALHRGPLAYVVWLGQQA